MSSTKPLAASLNVTRVRCPIAANDKRIYSAVQLSSSPTVVRGALVKTPSVLHRTVTNRSVLLMNSQLTTNDTTSTAEQIKSKDMTL